MTTSISRIPRVKTAFVSIQRLRILIVLFLIAASAYGALPDKAPLGAINDFAGILNQNTKDSLSEISASLFKATGVALIVVTTQTLDSVSIEDAATKLFEKWGIGKKGTDKGVLVLLSIADRSVRIETGYGVEGYITDVQSKRIIRDAAIPYFSKAQWNDGIRAIVFELTLLIASEFKMQPGEIIGMTDAMRVPPQNRTSKPNAFSIILLIVLFIFLMGTRSGRTILYMLIISSLFSGSSGRSGGGFGGGFGRSGGFGGFGGGMSGGGGASGRF